MHSEPASTTSRTTQAIEPNHHTGDGPSAGNFIVVIGLIIAAVVVWWFISRSRNQ